MSDGPAPIGWAAAAIAAIKSMPTHRVGNLLQATHHCLPCAAYLAGEFSRFYLWGFMVESDIERHADTGGCL